MYFGCGSKGASASIFGATVAVSELAGSTEYSGVGSVVSSEEASVVVASGAGLSDALASRVG